jgi:hypothetical protein
MRVLDKSLWGNLDQIPGWLSFSSADLTFRLLTSQEFSGVSGAVVEIGVYKGKYLALLAHASSARNRRIVGIDGFFAGFQKPLEQQWIGVATDEMKTNIRIGGGECQIDIVRADSADLSPRRFAEIVPEGAAFLSIDAGHEAHEVYNDFRVSTASLVPGAIVAADDVFNPVVPGVAEGVCRFLNSGEGRGLAPFATCGNKLFLTTRESHWKYFQLCRKIIESEGDGYLESSRRHYLDNQRIGYCPKMFGHEVLPFLG